MRVYSSTGMNITPESEFELEWTKTRARTTRTQERQLVQAVLICLSDRLRPCAQKRRRRWSAACCLIDIYLPGAYPCVCFCALFLVDRGYEPPHL